MHKYRDRKIKKNIQFTHVQLENYNSLKITTHRNLQKSLVTRTQKRIHEQIWIMDVQICNINNHDDDLYIFQQVCCQPPYS